MNKAKKIKHTPGPWHHSDVRTGRICISSEKMQVAVIPYLDNEAKANAALLTAAPDMLDLLKSLDSRGTFTPDDWPRIKAVIAKATGILYSCHPGDLNHD